MTDKHSVSLMIRYAVEEAEEAGLLFTAYLLKVAAESVSGPQQRADPVVMGPSDSAADVDFTH